MIVIVSGEMVRDLKLAMIGTRGIPARYGGFESCVEELSVRLARKGHEVTVYCRSDDPRARVSSYKGVILVHVPRLRRSFLESPFNSLLTTFHASLSGYDVLHFFGCGSVPFTLVARLAGNRVVLTVDGIEWERTSYSRAARLYLRSFAELAMVFPDSTVADSRTSQNWYCRRTGKCPVHIPYGASQSSVINEEVLQRYGVQKGKYIVSAGRLVHEKGMHTLVEAFKLVQEDIKLVIIGDFPAPSDYVRRLKESADSRTIFTGYIYGEDFESLRNGALAYIHPSLLEGTSISLLSAITAGLDVIASDLKENVDTAGSLATYFKTGDVKDLTSKLMEMLELPRCASSQNAKVLLASQAVQDWDEVATRYEDVYQEVVRQTR